MKNQKLTEQQIVKTLQQQQQQQPLQQQQQQHKMPPLEYATLSPTRMQYMQDQQKVTTTTTTTINFSHLPNCKYHAINQQQQQQHIKVCKHNSPLPQQSQPQLQQHQKTCQHSSPYHQQQQQQYNHHHHHHHHRQHKKTAQPQQSLQPPQQQQQQHQPVYHHHTLNIQESKHKKRNYTIKTQHYKSSPEINRTATSPTTTTTTKTSTTSTGKSQLWLSLPIPVQNKKKGIRRCRSYYNSFEDLDAKTRAEKRVVASLKYLCACTGATLRNLSKKTKNLHATQQQFTFTYTKPTWRHWGEEREKDAIFTVYLKKVRYHRPTPSVNNDSDDDISHLEWETVRVRFVKAATLARLVEALATVDGELESTFINVFLSTYRTFSTPKEVLNLLINRYDELHDKHMHELALSSKQNYHHYNNNNNNNNNHNNINNNLTRVQDSQSDCNMSIHEQHKKTLVSALHVWLDGFPEDWIEEQLRQLLAFAAKRLPRSELHVKVLQRLERILRQQMYQERSYADVVDLSDQMSDLCLAPAFRGPTHFLHAFRFPHVPVRHFAEQLTRMDSELFKRLIPHQCLGATWARRDRADCETVVATINQFNAVLFRVISSILIEPRLKPQDRALNIATWIDIAQELRLLKNFSSLKAIISGLQSNSIYRLLKIWAVLPKEKMEIFNELARIFSEDNNAWAQREVLMREGTAKFADTVGEHDRHLQKIIQKQSTQTSHGTIPYLGTFLTDLTMIHTAIPDTIEAANGDTLINFDKKRKEFEVLAQIKLLQGAANTYNLRDDPHFDRWFASMLVLDEREAHTLSCHLESPPAATRKSRSMHSYATNSSPGHRKTDSMTSNSSSGAGSQFYCDLNNSTSSHFSSSRQNSLDRDGQHRRTHTSMLSASSSVSNLSLDSSNSGGQKSSYTPGRMSHSHSAQVNANCDQQIPLINAQLVQSAQNIKSQAAPDFYIIRVTYETDNVEMDGIVLYKSIMLGNNERTPQVIRNAMLKLGLEANPDQWTLAQVLPDKELVMPRDANVYYAVNTNYNLNFILRPRKKQKD